MAFRGIFFVNLSFMILDFYKILQVNIELIVVVFPGQSWDEGKKLQLSIYIIKNQFFKISAYFCYFILLNVIQITFKITLHDLDNIKRSVFAILNNSGDLLMFILV